MPTKVLVIDDDTAITELMGLLLQTQGFDVVTTNSSVEGVKLAAELNPNIILLDLMMPELDGWQVCKAVRKFSNVPILVLSAVGDPGMVASALDSGADGFLSKPVPTSVLIAHIKKMTKRQTGSLANLSLMPKAESAAVRRNTQPIAS
jgi:DNA-binding response OmpR family regulator